MSYEAALDTVIHAVANSNDLSSLIEIALEQLLKSLHITCGAIWLMGSQVSQNVPPEVIAVFTELTQTTSAVAINDWRDGRPSGFPPRVAAAFGKAGLRASILVPILSEGRVQGRFVLLSAEARVWTNEEVAFARLISRQLGIAAERLLVRRLAQDTGTPPEVHTPRHAPYDRLKAIASTVGQGLINLSKADRAAIWLTLPDGQPEAIWVHDPGKTWTPTWPGTLFDPLDGRSAESAEPVWIPDLEQAPPDMKDLDLAEAPRGAVSFVPLSCQGSLLGALVCGYDAVQQWDAAFKTAFEVFAVQAAISLENAQRLQSHERRSHQLATLNEIAQSLTSTLDLEPLLNKILIGAVEILDCEAGSLLLTDESTGELVFEASVGAVAENLRGKRIPAGAGIAGKALTTRQSIIVNDVRQSKEWFPDTDQQTGFVTHAILVAPMYIKDRPLGVIEVINKQDGSAFVGDEVELLSSLASQAAIALENARLFHASHRRTEELEALRQASLHLTSSLELQPVLEAILEHALKLVAGDQAHIYLYDGERLTSGVSLWANRAASKRVTPPDDYGLIHTIARTGKRIYIPDTHNYPFFQLHPQEAAIVGLPLQKGSEVRGVMSISFTARHEFDQDELRVLELLADQAALALENAFLFEAAQKRLQELSNLSQASAALRDAETLKEMGPMLATQVALLVDADVTLVFLLDADRQRLTSVGAYGPSVSTARVESYLSDALLAQTLRTGSLPLMPDLEATPLALSDGLPENLRPAYSIPIRTTRGQIVGVFLVARRGRSSRRAANFRPEELRLLKTMAEIAGNALLRARSHEELESAYFQTVLALANAVDARDTYTRDHSQRLAILAEATAIEMNCTQEEVQAVHWGALLHDIGKIGVPDEVLSKPGPLSDTEWDVMRRHPDIGAQIVTPLKRLTQVVPIIRAHQEKYDGSGYPLGLKGEEIPLPARILAVVDAYSAITDERIYRPARSHDDALAEIQRCVGTHFDPRVVEAFLRVIENPWDD